MPSLIDQYFPGLSERQREQYAAMGPLYAEWNARINVISRQDIDNVYPHHILHSLSIALFMTPVDGDTFMDLGTGGGFPAIPLAVMWPECTFHLVDRVAKKLRVAQAVADALGLDNVTCQHGDASECHRQFHYVLSRAVMPLPALVNACRRHFLPSPLPGQRLPNGLICLKGGDLADEIAAARRHVEAVPLSDYFPAEPWYRDKYLLYLKV